MTGNRPLNPPRALLLDMDGTLTQPMLDFPRIKQEMGIGQRPILEALAEMDETTAGAARAVLDRHERAAAEQSSLNPGCLELLEWLGRAGIGSAIITRNCRASVDVVCRRHGLRIRHAITREDCAFKPDPAPLLLACRRLEIDPGDAWMVGDGEYDIAAGNRAGITTVWISHGRSREYGARSDQMVTDLVELLKLLRGIIKSEENEDQG